MATRANEDATMHPSIIIGGASLGHIDLSSSGLGCPLCPKFKTTKESVIKRHLSNHNANGVHFQDTIICRCNQSCRDGGHFHCPFCQKTVLRKVGMTIHVAECQKRCGMVQVKPGAPLAQSKPSSAETLEADTHSTLSALEDCIALSSGVEHSYTLPPLVYVLPVDHSYTVSLKDSRSSAKIALESCLSSSDVTSETSKSCSSSSDKAVMTAPQKLTTETVQLRPTHVMCPHCSMVLYKKNLVLHIQRRHNRPKEIASVEVIIE